MKNLGDNFDSTISYNLYRSVKEIIHPSISKRNISNYKIIIREDLLPLRVFYPNKLSQVDSFFLFIPGDGNVTGAIHNYSNIGETMAKNCNCIVFAMDINYQKLSFPSTLDFLNNTVTYLVEELKKNGIQEEQLTLVGESMGANLLTGVLLKRKQENNPWKGLDVLFYPILSGQYDKDSKYESVTQNEMLNIETLSKIKEEWKQYVGKEKIANNPLICPSENKDFKDYPTTLVITGNLDPLKSEGYEYYLNISRQNKKSKYINLEFASHGFLNTKDEEIKKEIYQILNHFLEKNKKKV